MWRNVDQIDSHQRKEVAIGPFPPAIMHVNNIFPALFFFFFFFFVFLLNLVSTGKWSSKSKRKKTYSWNTTWYLVTLTWHLALRFNAGKGNHWIPPKISLSLALSSKREPLNHSYKFYCLTSHRPWDRIVVYVHPNLQQDHFRGHTLSMEMFDREIRIVRTNKRIKRKEREKELLSFIIM